MKENMKNIKRVLSGIRATGRLHLGNYLGMVKCMLELQDNPGYEIFYMVADLHSMTTPYDQKTLASTAREVVLDYLSCGLEPDKSAVFLQSDLAELHTELMFYLSTVVTVARMQHLPTFKEKVKQYPQNVTMALLNYPVLMAADILIYKSSDVPTGIEDRKSTRLNSSHSSIPYTHFFFPKKFYFFFKDTAPTEIYTLPLHDALPIFKLSGADGGGYFDL